MLSISLFIIGFINYVEYLKQSLFWKWRQTPPAITKTRNKHTEQTKFLKFYVNHGNKAYKLLFLCNPYHQLSVIKDIVSFSHVFYC